MHLQTIFTAILLVGGLIVDASTLEKRFTKSKLDQFTAPFCDDRGGDSEANRTYRNINIKAGTCIDIDGSTHSIFLARGTGFLWRRNMVAYAETGCPSNQRIEQFYDHTSGSACMNVDTQMLGIAGSETHQGRIMSVKFTEI